VFLPVSPPGDRPTCWVVKPTMVNPVDHTAVGCPFDKRRILVGLACDSFQHCQVLIKLDLGIRFRRFDGEGLRYDKRMVA